ncbi:MAG: hypothetical protein PHN94_12135, partial [Bacteroidales bacterium]|nr:hypothetical protein [Bacteroidales bacterium]
ISPSKFALQIFSVEMTRVTMLMGEAGSGAKRPIPPPPPSHASRVISTEGRNLFVNKNISLVVPKADVCCNWLEN